MISPANYIVARGGFTLRRTHGIRGILQHLTPNLREDQKKSYHMSEGLLVLCQMVNPSLIIPLRS